MASKKRKKNNFNDNKVNNIEKENVVDNDTEECERILEQLDEMEKRHNMSSKIKNLIKEDKEAIRVMNENLRKLEEDELDYLDDEVMSDIEDERESKSEALEENVSKDEDIVDTKKAPDNKETEESETEDIEADETEDREVDATENIDDAEEANLDFFANLNKDDNIETDRIRKKSPKRLANDANKLSFADKLKLAARSNTKNFIVGTAIAFLFVMLVIALAKDAGNKDAADESKTLSNAGGEFIDVDTTPFIEVISNYYASLESGDVNVVRSLIADSDDITDDEINEKCKEAKAYAELVGSSFMITDCYVQEGLSSNEFIVYYKFQVTFKSIKTPTVGLFISYIVNETKPEDSTLDYKVCVGINDKKSDVYKYISKMSKCSNVTELFKNVDKELEDACKKDSDLKAIVDALKDTEEESESVDEETTEPMKDSESNATDKKGDSKETTKETTKATKKK